MLNNLYVDNLVIGVGSSESPKDKLAIHFYLQAHSIMHDENFNLCCSARKEPAIPKIIKSENSDDNRVIVHTLALRWSTASDCITLTPKKHPAVETDCTSSEPITLVTKRA